MQNRIVTAAVIEKNGKILIAKRKSGDNLEHKWEFPGGKLEVGETPEECLRRELYEEFGIDTDIGEYFCSSIYEYKHISVELRAYRVKHKCGDFKLHSHEEILWVDIHDLEKFDFAEADRPIAKKIMEACQNAI